MFTLCAAYVSNRRSLHTGSHPLGFRSAHWLLIVSCYMKVAGLVILLTEYGRKKNKKQSKNPRLILRVVFSQCVGVAFTAKA